eukprot:Anaeramoba_ignava/a478821_33.p1 GENE.a478821_33~~a478821_33.p1  ORF type:complete len:749 (+),score=244.33 a478821_33:215-2461(+)
MLTLQFLFQIPLKKVSKKKQKDRKSTPIPISKLKRQSVSRLRNSKGYDQKLAKSPLSHDNSRDGIINQIGIEEELFSQDLKTFTNIWKKYFQQNLTIKETSLEQVFELANQLIEQQQKFAQRISTSTTQNIFNRNQLSEIFTIIDLELYKKWLSQFKQNIQTIFQFDRENLEINSLLKKFQNESSGMDFYYYLSRPLEMIENYCAFLHQLMNLEQNKPISEFSKFKSLLEKFEKIQEEFSSEFFVFQQYASCSRIEKQLENISIKLFHPQRYLNSEGKFRRVSRTKNYDAKYFMFNDFLLLGKRKKNRQLTFNTTLFYNKCKIRDLPDDDSGEIQHAVEFLVEDDPDRFIFCFGEEDDKTQFWEDLTEKLKVEISDSNKVSKSKEEIINKRKELSALVGVNQKISTENIELFHAEKTDMQQRTNVIMELVQTEEQYNKDLEVIIENYLKPLKQKSIVNEKDIRAMFSVITEIYGLNQQILQSLKQEYPGENDEAGKMNVGKIFMQYVNFLKIYTQYCANHSQSMNIVAKYSKKDSFENFLQHQKETIPECKGLGVLDFLIKPIQRICKYPLLFKELLKSTNQTYSDYQDLAQAYQALYGVAAYVNEKKRSAEQSMVLVGIYSTLSGIPKSFEFVHPTRHFIQNAVLKKKSVKRVQERNFWLFNDVIVYAKSSWSSKKKKYQYKGHLCLAEALIRDLSSEDHSFQLIPFGSKKGYTIYCDNEEQKIDWINKIKDQITRLAELGIKPSLK